MIRTQSRTPSLYSYSPDDPLSLVLKPPPTESDEERERRIRAEIEAKLVSDRIDEQIRTERESKKRNNMEVKVRILSPTFLHPFLQLPSMPSAKAKRLCVCVRAFK